MGHVLDNPAWHALVGPQGELAEWLVDGHVARFPRDVSPFWAVDRLDGDTWEHLRTATGGRAAVVFARSGEVEAPDDWHELFGEPLHQYVAESPDPDREIDGLVDLGADDVPEMIALTQATEPGPFLERTHELGHYIGVRRDGVLLAMAGERLRTPDYSEISAVCVHPDARRQGLAAALTTRLVHEIRGRGQEAMLHVRFSNDPAHELYRRIGFVVRTVLTVGAWRMRPTDA